MCFHTDLVECMFKNMFKGLSAYMLPKLGFGLNPGSFECRCMSAARGERLKQAKAEAEKEIKTYKKQREDQYHNRIEDVHPCFSQGVMPAHSSEVLPS